MASYFYRIKNAIVGEAEPNPDAPAGENEQRSDEYRKAENDIRSPNSASSKKDPQRLSTLLDEIEDFSVNMKSRATSQIESMHLTKEQGESLYRYRAQNESTNKHSYISNNGSSVKEYEDEFYLTNSQILDDKATLHKPVPKKRMNKSETNSPVDNENRRSRMRPRSRSMGSELNRRSRAKSLLRHANDDSNVSYDDKNGRDRERER
eukprot:jgi/Orpsp1_1/1187493/evm.model.d7180000058130.1